MQIEFPKPKWWQRLILNFAASRVGSSLFSLVLARLDRFTLGVTADKKTLTTLVTGVPVVQLTTYGRISGKPRVCPLTPVVDGEKLVLFATNFGAKRHPSWYHNLTANPEVLVSLNGYTDKYVARDADDSERIEYWRLAIAIYPGYRSYAARSGGRKIPIVVLSPKESV